MRDGPDGEVLAGAYRWTPQVSSWLGGDLLADEVPVVSGRLSVDVAQQIPERLTFTVPEWAGGVSWVPDSPRHPLAKFGQFVDVSVTVTSSVTGEEWQTRLGRFQVQAWTHDDVAGSVDVECVGLLQRPGDARFTTPQVPRAGGTLGSEFVRLMVDGIPVLIDERLADRAVPTSFQWDEDRLGALYDLADAWPARIRMDEFGQCRVLPPLGDTPVPVLTFTDGIGGTLVSAPTEDTRDGVYNVVVARSSATDDPSRPPVQGQARVTAGPFSADGPYGAVVRFWSSPLATTKAQLDASAASLLADAIRPASQRVVTCPPDPRVDVDDAVQVRTGARVASTSTPESVDGGSAFTSSAVAIDGGAAGDPGGYLLGGAADTSFGESTVTLYDSSEPGWVVGYDLPLTASDGPMTVRVGVAA